VTRLDQLNRLLRELRTNPFYAPRLPEQVASLDEFFARVPYTTKQELVTDQQAHPPFGSNLTYPIERYTRIFQTSGTTGRPLYWLDTAESWDWTLGNWERVYRAAGVTEADRIFFAFSFGMFLGFWSAFESAGRIGSLRIPGGGMTSAARLRAMLDTGATVLCCTPTYALRLAEVAREEGIALGASRVRRILVAGEPGGSMRQVRARIEGEWPGARVYDHHGMTETGPASYQCPARAGVLHIIEAAFLPEVTADGELALTNLGRLGSPLIRYRTGDLVKPESGECECGSRELSLIGGILGRVDDMLVIRGVNVFPAAVDEVLRGFAEVAEYRVEVDTSHSLAELRIQIEPAAVCANPEHLAGRVRQQLHNVFALRIPVAIAPTGSLPRFEMKARRWITAR
jgi:phenylacetate-CoA ligase